MNPDITRDIANLTSTINDAKDKPLLRPSIALGLRDLGHAPEEVEVALDEYYKTTVH